MSALRRLPQTIQALLNRGETFSRPFIQWIDDLTYKVNAIDTDGAGIRQIDADLGSTPSLSGSFTFDDNDITSSKRIIITQAPGPYPGKGSDADEAEMDAVTVCAKAGTRTATAYWNSTTPVMGTFLFNYTVH